MAHHIEVDYIIRGTTAPKDRFTAAGSSVNMAGAHSDVGSVVSLLDADGRIVRQVLYPPRREDRPGDGAMSEIDQPSSQVDITKDIRDLLEEKPDARN